MLNKVVSIYTIEYYCCFKNKEVLPHTTIHKDPEENMLSDTSHKRRNTVRFHLCEVIRFVKFVETEKRRIVAKEWRRKE